MNNNIYNSNLSPVAATKKSIIQAINRKTVNPETHELFEFLMKKSDEYYSQELSRRIKEGIRKSKERKAALQNGNTSNENKGE